VAFALVSFTAVNVVESAVLITSSALHRTLFCIIV